MQKAAPHEEEYIKDGYMSESSGSDSQTFQAFDDIIIRSSSGSDSQSFQAFEDIIVITRCKCLPLQAYCLQHLMQQGRPAHRRTMLLS